MGVDVAGHEGHAELDAHARFSSSYGRPLVDHEHVAAGPIREREVKGRLCEHESAQICGVLLRFKAEQPSERHPPTFDLEHVSVFFPTKVLLVSRRHLPVEEIVRCDAAEQTQAPLDHIEVERCPVLGQLLPLERQRVRLLVKPWPSRVKDRRADVDRTHEGRRLLPCVFQARPHDIAPDGAGEVLERSEHAPRMGH